MSSADQAISKARVAMLVRSKGFENFILALIIFNAVLLGLETFPSIAQRYGGFLGFLNDVILAIFVVEIVARIWSCGLRFWRDGWSWFDMTVVAIALIPATGGFEAVRALRAIRLLRLITVVPSLRRVVEGLIRAIPGIGSIVVLLLLLVYVSAIVATRLFGESAPDHFGSLGASAFSLFQIMTLEGWPDIARPLVETHAFAWLFFVIYIMVSSYAVLNLFIGIIVEAMQSEAEARFEAMGDVVEEEHDIVMRELRGMREELAEIRRALDHK